MKKKEKTFKFPGDQCNFGKIESESIKKCGWYAHYVFDETDCPLGTNIHTHGIKENFGHLDLQVCFKIPQQIAHGILWAVFNIIESGKTLKPGEEFDGVLAGYKVKSILAKESGRDVIRIVLPDKDGTYSGQFAEQLKKTGREKIN